MFPFWSLGTTEHPPFPPGISGCLWVCGSIAQWDGGQRKLEAELGVVLSPWVGGPVTWAIVRGMDVSASGFLLELRDCGPGLP